MTSPLIADRLTFAYDSDLSNQVRPVLTGFSCEFAAEKINVLVGPNGCGKSTLLKLLAGVNRPQSGRVLVGEADLASMAARERARQIGILLQENLAAADLTVRELVLEGRYPHLKFLARPGAEDFAKAEEAIEVCGVTAFADRPVGSLSSGQRRLAWIAMAVAQDPKWLLLDAPTPYLDIARDIAILRLVTRLTREMKMSVVLSIHDLNSAAAIADTVTVMKEGALVTSGTAAETLTPATLKAVFDAEAKVISDPSDGRPRIFWEGL